MPIDRLPPRYRLFCSSCFSINQKPGPLSCCTNAGGPSRSGGRKLLRLHPEIRRTTASALTGAAKRFRDLIFRRNKCDSPCHASAIGASILQFLLHLDLRAKEKLARGEDIMAPLPYLKRQASQALPVRTKEKRPARSSLIASFSVDTIARSEVAQIKLARRLFDLVIRQEVPNTRQVDCSIKT